MVVTEVSLLVVIITGDTGYTEVLLSCSEVHGLGGTFGMIIGSNANFVLAK